MIKRKSLDIISLIAVSIIFFIPFSLVFFWFLGLENPFMYSYLTGDFKPNAGLTFYGLLCAVVVMVFCILIVMCQRGRLVGVLDSD